MSLCDISVAVANSSFETQSCAATASSRRKGRYLARVSGSSSSVGIASERYANSGLAWTSSICRKHCQYMWVAIFLRERITYGDLVGLIGSVLLHEPLGSRGRDVRDGGGTVGSFSRHDGWSCKVLLYK